MADDPRLNAARYRAQKAARDNGFADDEVDERPAATPTAQERALYVESAIQQAIRQGEFDNLPGYGKPLEGLGYHHDPDWWIRRKIQTEKLTGLGPPALQLRVEHAEFEARVDALPREHDVREYIDDFNRRVIDARRQLQGGPPVVTPTRDVDAEVRAWRSRRSERLAAQETEDASVDAAKPRRRWWRPSR